MKVLRVSEEFVSIAQSAKAIGVSERTARRLAEQLAEHDRTTGAGYGRRVRLSAMLALRAEALKPAQIGQTSDTMTGHNQATGNRHDRTQETANRQMDTGMDATLADWRARALVAEARAELLEKSVADTQAERDRLDRKLDEALAIARAAQDEARAGRLLGRGRSVQQIEASGLTGGDSGEASGTGGGIVPSGTAEAIETPQKGIRAWLRRIW